MADIPVAPADYLKQLGQSGEGPYDIALAALMLAALDHPGESLDAYVAHLDEIALAMRTDVGPLTNVEDVARSITTTMTARFKYEGDRVTYDDPQNGDLMRVIDRRRGLPVALGVLYLHAARAAGCQAQGLNTPAHFLLRISRNDREALIDPFHGGAALERERLDRPPRAAPMASGGLTIEAVSDAEVLLRLENNLKLRALEGGDKMRGLEIARRMALIAPRRAEVWLDLARMNETVGVLGAARAAYEACLEIATPGQNLHNEAALALYSLKRKLN